MEMDKRNLFQLLVELSFFNGVEEETQKFYSKPFLMRSRPRNKKRKHSGEYTRLRGLLFIRDGNYFLRALPPKQGIRYKKFFQVLAKVKHYVPI